MPLLIKQHSETLIKVLGTIIVVAMLTPIGEIVFNALKEVVETFATETTEAITNLNIDEVIATIGA